MLWTRKKYNFSLLLKQELYFLDNNVPLEIKTEFVDVPKYSPKLSFKYLKWYLQSYLAGINMLIIGKKSDYTHVQHITSIKIDQLQEYGRDFWNLDSCMNFLCAYMERMKAILDSRPD